MGLGLSTTSTIFFAMFHLHFLIHNYIYNVIKKIENEHFVYTQIIQFCEFFESIEAGSTSELRSL